MKVHTEYGGIFMVKHVDDLATGVRNDINLSKAPHYRRKMLSRKLTDQLTFDFFEPLDSGVNGLQVDEIMSITDLLNVEQVMSVLRRIDWSFTEEDTQYLSHDIHPYPAKFIPQIPAHLIARLSLPGKSDLYPFGGAVTTAIKSLLPK